MTVLVKFKWQCDTLDCKLEETLCWETDLYTDHMALTRPGWYHCDDTGKDFCPDCTKFNLYINSEYHDKPSIPE